MDHDDELPDAELWSAALAGDGSAFGALFDRHRNRLFRAALRSLSPDEAEDAVAATFLELWRHQQTVRLLDGSLAPWLLATLHNVSRNFARQQRRYRAFLRRLPAAQSERSAEDVVTDASEGLERHEQLHTVLSRLSSSDAQVLTLVGLEQLSVAEVASLLRVSPEAVKQRLSRARRRARELDQRMSRSVSRSVTEGARIQ